MKSNCQICDKNIGKKEQILSPYLDKILCRECYNSLPLLIKEYDMKIPIACKNFGFCLGCEKKCEAFKNKQKIKKMLEGKKKNS
jgi:hypothetical protein